MARRILILLMLTTFMVWGQTHFQPVQPTGLPYIVIISSIDLAGSGVDTTAEIGVFDGAVCVGAARVSALGNSQVTTWQAVSSQQLPGFQAGDSMGFRVWAEGEEILCTASYTLGDGTFGSGPYSVVNLTETLTATVPDTRYLSTGLRLTATSASPFNGAITLAIGLPDKRSGKLLIFNLTGQRVAAFTVSGNQALNWDAQDAAGRDLPSGIYLIVLAAGNQKQAQRIVLVR